MSRFTWHDIVEAQKVIDPVFLNSPQYEFEPLNEILGARVVLKVETQNPIRSFKGRGAELLVSKTNQPLICASAGNFGQAMAYACRKKSLPLTIMASVNANPFKIKRMRALGAEVILDGQDFDAAKVFAKTTALERGLRFIEDSADVETAIGAGTIGLELLSYPTEIQTVLVPVGNGALINGIGKAYKHGNPKTRIIGVQASGAPAMIESWKSNTIVTYPNINTIADGIGVRIPVPEALTDMKEVIDEGVLVSEEYIFKAMKLLFRVAGLITEPSGAIAIAAIMECPTLFRNKTIGAIICGSNLTDEQLKNWIAL
jgi:threonine dehydratase